jgi:hypothetical protein
MNSRLKDANVVPAEDCPRFPWLSMGFDAAHVIKALQKITVAVSLKARCHHTGGPYGLISPTTAPGFRPPGIEIL